VKTAGNSNAMAKNRDSSLKRFDLTMAPLKLNTPKTTSRGTFDIQGYTANRT
jgi:hypothetical protein